MQYSAFYHSDMTISWFGSSFGSNRIDRVKKSNDYDRQRSGSNIEMSASHFIIRIIAPAQLGIQVQRSGGIPAQ
jgi:hypothetical protein